MDHVYIHIPFCSNICSYCDFCKVFYNKDIVKNYLDCLDNEISSRYNGGSLKTLYIGGGTPSCLSISELERLFLIIDKFDISSCEFTFECNVEDTSYDKLKFLYDHGVNRISIGVQTFNPKFLKFLNRNHTKDMVFNLVNMAHEIGFKNINVDIMYALKDESMLDLERDIDFLLKLDVCHISTYSLIIEEHTKLFIDGVSNIDEDLDFRMYDFICNKLEDNGYIHYETSNFARHGFFSKHNLNYWDNMEYYGFGCGASGYIDGVRYDNTRSLTKYLNGEFLGFSEVLSLSDKISNEFILGFRKINGININDFNKKYGNIFKYDVVNRLIKEGKLINDGCNIFINPIYIYISNTILVDFIGEVYE